MKMDALWIVDPAATSIAFGPFRLFPMQRLLTEGGAPIRIGSRAFDILVALIERPGELVTKEELMARVWPNTIVESANLAVHISALRRVLGDGCDGHRYVVNIPGRGYRFVAAVTVENDLRSEAPSVSPARDDNAPRHSAPPAGQIQEVRELVQKLQQRRLLNIVGPDSIDKTTIALALFEKLIEGHENGVWLVGLTPCEEV